MVTINTACTTLGKEWSLSPDVCNEAAVDDTGTPVPGMVFELRVIWTPVVCCVAKTEPTCVFVTVGVS